ncbi:hypothetical protein EDD16DRAFT_1586020 [Pisolithus croceorrhizus]|nr:hypothetical protein EDD16DRAFT_1586020 [Pisolithus croceorrhizus]
MLIRFLCLFPPTMTTGTTSTTRSSLPHVTPHRSHTLPSTKLFSSQVGGHAGIQTTQDGSLLLKPVLLAELECYRPIRDGVPPDIDAATATASGLKPLLPWIPKLSGVVSLGNYLVDNSPDMNAMHDLSAFVQGSGKMTTIVPHVNQIPTREWDQI